MKKYEVGKLAEANKFSSWFKYCSKQQIPYILIKNKTKYATIEWDHITFEPKFDRILDLNGERNKSKIIKAFMKYADDKSEYTISNVLLYVKKMPIENAPKFAEEVYDIISTALN